MESIKTIYKIGHGPSSSHTLGPKKAAERILKEYPLATHFEVILKGSLALTGKGHLTDMIILETLKDRASVVFDKTLRDLKHPNTLIFKIYQGSSLIDEVTFYSIGGGNIVKEGEELTFKDVYKESTFQEIKNVLKKENCKLIDYILKREDDDILEYMNKVYDTMIDSCKRGIEREGYLPGSLKVKRKAYELYHNKKPFEPSKIQSTRLISAYAFAALEENASGGLIVTAPTCGSCGVVASICKYLEDENVPRNTIIEGLLIAGLVGNIIRYNASISGAECGCQAEVGSASSMGAALYSYVIGNDLEKMEVAMEMAMEHNLGLTCDPVEGYVQIPCIERNAVAALRAIDVAIISLTIANNEYKVSFDDVVKTMYETGLNLHESYKETSNGGLAKTLKKYC